MVWFCWLVERLVERLGGWLGETVVLPPAHNCLAPTHSLPFLPAPHQANIPPPLMFLLAVPPAAILFPMFEPCKPRSHAPLPSPPPALTQHLEVRHRVHRLRQQLLQRGASACKSTKEKEEVCSLIQSQFQPRPGWSRFGEPEGTCGRCGGCGRAASKQEQRRRTRRRKPGEARQGRRQPAPPGSEQASQSDIPTVLRCCVDSPICKSSPDMPEPRSPLPPPPPPPIED